MSQKNEVKQDLWGNVYIETRDESGNVLYRSKRKEDVFTGEYYDTYDAQGNWIGHSKPGQTIFDQRYIETYDQNGKLIQVSFEKTDLFGKVYWSIEDAHGKPVGIGRDGTVTYYDEDTDSSDVDTSGHSPGETDTRTSKLPAGGGTFGMILSVVLMFGIGVLFTALHDPSGRETIHRFVTPLIGTIPLAILLLTYFIKLTAIPGSFKTSVFALCCLFAVLLQGYYVFYTMPSMEWLLRSDSLYYGLWLLPYGLYFGLCYLLKRLAEKASRAMQRSDILLVLHRLHDPAGACFCLSLGLMVLRWEFVSGDGRYGRLLVEILTIAFVFAVALGAMAIGEKIIYKKGEK